MRCGELPWLDRAPAGGWLALLVAVTDGPSGRRVEAGMWALGGALGFGQWWWGVAREVDVGRGWLGRGCSATGVAGCHERPPSGFVMPRSDGEVPTSPGCDVW